MTRVTHHYGISGPIEFLDVHVDQDKPLFLDPRAIRLQPKNDPFAAAANTCTRTFFDQVVTAVKTNDSTMGLALLQRFSEPRETRLGLAKSGFDGHGGAEKVGRDIWQVLSTDLEALIRIGYLKELEAVPAFVGGVGSDITSDLTTRIAFEPLADFTAKMMRTHPELRTTPHSTHVAEHQVWDPTSLEWVDKSLELPYAGGRPLLLVPRNWARPNLLMNAERYYDKTVLDFAQLEQVRGRHPRTGKLIVPSKDDLREQEALKQGKGTSLAVTMRAHRSGQDLIALFASFVDGKYEPVDDAKLEEKLR